MSVTGWSMHRINKNSCRFLLIITSQQKWKFLSPHKKTTGCADGFSLSVEQFFTGRRSRTFAYIAARGRRSR